MAEPAAAPENETSAEAAPAAAPTRKLMLPLIIAAGLVVGGAAGALVGGEQPGFVVSARPRCSKELG